MNITSYALPRTLKPDFIVLIRIVYDQYQCSSGYRDSSTYLGQEMCILSHACSYAWEEGEGGCRRGIECLYLHLTTGIESENEKSLENKEYPCEGCKYTWKDKNCMKEHIIKNRRIFFCLNCDDWIKDKNAVFNYRWTMFDDAGILRTDV